MLIFRYYSDLHLICISFHLDQDVKKTKKTFLGLRKVHGLGSNGSFCNIPTFESHTDKSLLGCSTPYMCLFCFPPPTVWQLESWWAAFAA